MTAAKTGGSQTSTFIAVKVPATTDKPAVARSPKERPRGSPQPP